MATGYSDGASGAPGGTAELPTLLNGYVARPPWEVAGVDYHVGQPDGTTLKDPATLAMAGVSVNASNHSVTVTGSNVTLSGYDFGLAGGWGIAIQSGVTNTVIENSHFLVGSNNNVPINAEHGSGSLTVQNNTIDGGGVQSGTVWALINYAGSGTFVAQYNNLLNAPEDAIDFGGGGPMTTFVQYNTFQNLGTSPGAHADAVQYDGVNASNSVISFNTITSGEEGIQLAAQDGSTLTSTAIDNNVIVAKGPGTSMSYAIAVQQWAGNTVNGVAVDSNYIDFSGALGPFYSLTSAQTTLPTNATFGGNVNMTTGAQIANPTGSSSGSSTLTPAPTQAPAPMPTPSPTPTGTTYNPGAAGGTITTLGADTVNVGSGAVTVYANGPSANVIGGAGALTFIGSSGSDTVVGGQGAVNIAGNGDMLNFTEGSGNATVKAGSGKEIYNVVLGQAGNHLTISDFVSGTDSIHLSGYQWHAISNEQTVAGSTQITLTDNTQITLLGVAGLANRDIFTRSD